MRRLIKQTIFSVYFQQNVVVDDGHWCYPKDLQGLSQGWFCSTTTTSKGTPATFNFEVRVAVRISNLSGHEETQFQTNTCTHSVVRGCPHIPGHFYH